MNKKEKSILKMLLRDIKRASWENRGIVIKQYQDFINAVAYRISSNLI